MFKKMNESIVQTFIQELKQDKIFVESVNGKKYVIKGFRLHDNCISILKQTEFKLYVIPGAEGEVSYAIKWELVKYKNLDSVAELYKLAQEKLNEPNYKNKSIKRYNDMVKEQNNLASSFEDPMDVAAKSVAAMGR